MKTGKFAEKYNLTSNGVRYYVEQGLLTPQIKGTQYDFGEECDVRMQEIQQLKQMNFSLEEINKIFHTRNLTQYTLNTNAIRKYNSIFYDKISELEIKIHDMENSIKQIKSEMILQKKSAPGYVAGVPLCAMQLMICPQCGETLQFSDVEIRNNKILSGKVACSCSYELELRDGVVINGHVHDMKIEWSNILNLLSECSTDYISLEAKAYYRIKNNMLDYLEMNNKSAFDGVIITSGGYAGDFICKYPELFDENALIVVADQNLNVIEYIKDKLGTLNDRLQILYICDSDFHLPLKNNSIDCFLDDYSSSEFIFYNPEYPVSRIKHLLKEDAVWMGVFTYYSKYANTVSTIKREFPNSDPARFYMDTFKNQITSSGFELIEHEFLGSTNEPGSGLSFDYHDYSEPLHFCEFFARKNAQPTV